VNHHGAGLRTLTGGAELSKALARDYSRAEIEPADRAMLDYVVKLTRTPGEMSEADVEKLHEVGFDDTSILDICQVTSYYNYVNRLADGTGVELEPYWSEEEMTITRDELEALRREFEAP
jgi:uncharacterized peroxidase-related enzyme